MTRPAGIFTYNYATIGDNARQQLILQRINQLEQEQYLSELEAHACQSVGDEEGAVKAQNHADFLHGKIMALGTVFDSFVVPLEETDEAQETSDPISPPAEMDHKEEESCPQ